jgi:hypothetical protein
MTTPRLLSSAATSPYARSSLAYESGIENDVEHMMDEKRSLSGRCAACQRANDLRRSSNLVAAVRSSSDAAFWSYVLNTKYVVS